MFFCACVSHKFYCDKLFDAIEQLVLYISMTSLLQFHLITTVRWQCPCSGYVGFIFVQCEEEKTQHTQSRDTLSIFIYSL